MLNFVAPLIKRLKHYRWGTGQDRKVLKISECQINNLNPYDTYTYIMRLELKLSAEVEVERL